LRNNVSKRANTILDEKKGLRVVPDFEQAHILDSVISGIMTG